MKGIFITVYDVNFHSKNFTNIHKFLTICAFFKNTTRKRARQHDFLFMNDNVNWMRNNFSQQQLYGTNFLKSFLYIKNMLLVELFFSRVFLFYNSYNHLWRLCLN